MVQEEPADCRCIPDRGQRSTQPVQQSVAPPPTEKDLDANVDYTVGTDTVACQQMHKPRCLQWPSPEEQKGSAKLKKSVWQCGALIGSLSSHLFQRYICRSKGCVDPQLGPEIIHNFSKKLEDGTTMRSTRNKP